jgi:hypothetical protein
MTPARFPNQTHRTTIIGKTGSGKTQFAAHLLSHQPFDQQPYVILDYKHDELLNSVPGVQELKLGTLPKHPGLYIVHAMDGDDDTVEQWLWDVFWHGKIGLYFDEGTMVPNVQKYIGKTAIKAILSQGRSRRVPAITVTQRPSGILPAFFSEADFVSCFYLRTEPDKKRVRELMPVDCIDGLQQNYHSRWYDVSRDVLTYFRPVPDGDSIRAQFDRRLTPLKRGWRWRK